jgi:uncharacterized protein DUF4082
VTSYRLMDGASGRPGVGSSGTRPPASSTSFANPIVQGLSFKVTQSGYQIQGYWYWRSDSAQPASASFALWQLTGKTAGTLIAGSSASASSMVAAQWNYVPLAAPITLTANVPYMACVGSVGNFNFTPSQFGGGQPYVAGIINGPLSGYSSDAGSAGGSSPSPFDNWQFQFSTPASSDPALLANFPSGGNSDYNGWLDVQVGLPATPVVTFGSTSGGVDTYNVAFAGNDTGTGGTGTHPMRVLAPTAPAPGYDHAFLWLLPVEPDQGTSFGDSIATVQALGANNQYNLTCIQPGYAINPWFADSPVDPGTQQETFMTGLVTWVKANLATTGTERHYLIGFSKSGLGGQGLQFRNPGLYAATASWDAPFMMTSYDGNDPDSGPVGGGSAAVYGTAANFTNNYQLSSGNLTAWKNAGNFGTVSRLWLGGYASFQQDVIDYDALLTSGGIKHTLGPMVSVTHAWHTAWVSSALAAIIPSSSLPSTGKLTASSAPLGILTASTGP